MSIFDAMAPVKSTEWLRSHADYPHDDWCLIWPFSRTQNGYAQVGADKIAAHRIMCEAKNGPPPSATHHAAHSCGRGHEGCINPCHLSWKTPSENHLERYEHSGPIPRRKLTPEQVDEIRALRGRDRTQDVAERYGVTAQNIRMIQNGKSWRKERIDQRIFTREEVDLIRATPWQDKSARVWADEFGVNRTVIDRIRGGVTYKYWPMPSSTISSRERL